MALIHTSELSPLHKGFLFSVKDKYTEVWTQHGDTCMAISATHMMIILYRKKEPTLQLSPQALLTHVKKGGISREVVEVVLKKGLEKRNFNEKLWAEVPNFEYTQDRKRYRLARLDNFKGLYRIIRVLRKNFDSGGRRYPVMALCNHMNSLSSAVASKTTMEAPYRWGAKQNLEDIYTNVVNFGLKVEPTRHAMLITGMHTMVENPGPLDYSLEVKNSEGRGWGCNGVAWVTADLFESILVPVMPGDEPMEDLEWTQKIESSV